MKFLLLFQRESTVPEWPAKKEAGCDPKDEMRNIPWKFLLVVEGDHIFPKKTKQKQTNDSITCSFVFSYPL